MEAVEGSKSPKGLAGVRKVFFMGEFAKQLPPSAVGDGQPGIAEVSGRNPCHYAELVVLDDLKRVCVCEDVEKSAPRVGY